MPLDEEACYLALTERNPEFEGVFYVGVRTTGVFCRPTCPARPPKRENCEFFTDARQAMLASYRPCKRCRPLSHPNETSDVVRLLVDAVERARQALARRGLRRAPCACVDRAPPVSQAVRDDLRRVRPRAPPWRRVQGDPRRRARDHGPARRGLRVGSGFRDAFARVMGAPPASRSARALRRVARYAARPDDGDRRRGGAVSAGVCRSPRAGAPDRAAARSRQAGIVPGRTGPIAQIERELAAYFDGSSMRFETPLARLGSPFQTRCGTRCSPSRRGRRAAMPSWRARSAGPGPCARREANGANPFAIVVPCHRVINADGALGGYGGGLPRKRWLLDHERKADAAGAWMSAFGRWSLTAAPGGRHLSLIHARLAGAGLIAALRRPAARSPAPAVRAARS